MKKSILMSAVLLAGACTTSLNQEADLNSDPNDVSSREPTIKGVRYVMSSVSDLDRTIAFYQSSVNYDVVKRYRIDSSHYDSALLAGKGGEAEVALIKTPTVFLKLVDFDLEDDTPGQAGSISGPGYTHVCYQSLVSNSAYDKFRTAGLKMITRGDRPADRGYGTAYAYGTDPDGTMIEMEVQERTRRDESSWIGHVANATVDLERMLSFYEVLLGYPAHRRAEIANSEWADSVGNIDGLVMKGGWSMVANLGLEFWQFEHPVTSERTINSTIDTKGYGYLAFEVLDLNSEVARLKAEDVEFVGEVIEEEGWQMIFGYDPDGTLFSLQQNVSADPSESIDEMLWIDRSRL